MGWDVGWHMRIGPAKLRTALKFKYFSGSGGAFVTWNSLSADPKQRDLPFCLYLFIIYLLFPPNANKIGA